MAKKKWRDAWSASLTVLIPIDAADPATVAAAKAAVEKLAASLPAGATVEITRAGFGKMELSERRKEITPAANESKGLEAKQASEGITSAPRQADIPTSLDKRPRQAAE